MWPLCFLWTPFVRTHITLSRLVTLPFWNQIKWIKQLYTIRHEPLHPCSVERSESSRQSSIYKERRTSSFCCFTSPLNLPLSHDLLWPVWVWEWATAAHWLILPNQYSESERKQQYYIPHCVTGEFQRQTRCTLKEAGPLNLNMDPQVPGYRSRYYTCSYFDAAVVEKQLDISTALPEIISVWVFSWITPESMKIGRSLMPLVWSSELTDRSICFVLKSVYSWRVFSKSAGLWRSKPESFMGWNRQARACPPALRLLNSRY